MPASFPADLVMTPSPDPFPLAATAFSGDSRSVPAGNAFDWLRQGWALFTAAPGAWMAIMVLAIVIYLGLSIVPLIGQLAAHLLTPVFGGGILIGCRKLSAGETLEIADLFAGFKQNTGNLAMLGLIYMAGMAAIVALTFLVGGGSLAGGMMMGRHAGMGVAFGGVLLALLLVLILSTPLVMAMLYAPALVVFNGMLPIPAMKASFNACVKNTLAFLVFGLIALVLCFFAALPIGLGFLVLGPVLSGALYVSYRDIFVGT